ncbi:MAG: FAD-dependent oxidoreductase [Spirochaetes bacterium]|nr:MAG: FAD-dependent oxidoreductase [Spirochaetota bacterium]
MESFDAIIVGAGLSGLSAAYALAKEGLDVLVLERGDYPGAKNVSGGRLYLNPVRELFPDLWEKAPFERHIAHEEFCLMDRARAVTVRYEGAELDEKPQSFSVLRAKLDRWLAKEAQGHGAAIVCKTRVDGLIMENGRVAGIRAGGDELRSAVVIACDGALSRIAQGAGLAGAHAPKHFATGYKEVIEMDRGVIEDRFNLEGDQGTARLYLGDPTAGRLGGGFIYTNKESLSIGVVAGIDAMTGSEPACGAAALLDAFKKRPEVARLLRGGETVEYSSHVIPEGGLAGMPRLFGDGILVAGDAAGLAMNLGITVRGMEYALASGYYAARTVIEAKKTEDFGVSALARYPRMLAESFVMKDFTAFKNAPRVLDNPRFFSRYPQLAGGLLRDLYEVPAGVKERLYKTARRHFTVKEMFAMARDLAGVRKV